MTARFFTFEGPEGAGKSTQIRTLAGSLERAGHRVVCTREPGGTAIGERIRDILLAVTSKEMCAETEALLLIAARAQHIREVIRPAILRGEVVLCDRFTDSTFAYQGGGRGLPIEALRGLQHFATGDVRPSLRILLDLPVEAGLQRRYDDVTVVNRMDQEDLGFHYRVRDAYLTMAAADPCGWTIVDATRPMEIVASDVLNAVMRVLLADATSITATVSENGS